MQAANEKDRQLEKMQAASEDKDGELAAVKAACTNKDREIEDATTHIEKLTVDYESHIEDAKVRFELDKL